MTFRTVLTSTVDQAARAQAAQAIAAAAAAQGTADDALTSANGKVEFFTEATAPAYTGAADTAVWIDTAKGRRINRWDGAEWEPQPFGNLALAPGSIVASEVLVEGSVSAELLEADAVDARTITGSTVRTAATGKRAVMGPMGTGVQGGGGVALYPNTGSPGIVEAGTDSEVGAHVAISSPPNAKGLRGSLLVTQTELSGSEPLTLIDDLNDHAPAVYARSWVPAVPAGRGAIITARTVSAAFNGGLANVTWPGVGQIAAVLAFNAQPAARADLILSVQNVSPTGCQIIARDSAGAGPTVTLVIYLLIFGN